MGNHKTKNLLFMKRHDSSSEEDDWTIGKNSLLYRRLGVSNIQRTQKNYSQGNNQPN